MVYRPTYEIILGRILKENPSPITFNSICQEFSNKYLERFQFPPQWRMRLLKRARKLEREGKILAGGGNKLTFSLPKQKGQNLKEKGPSSGGTRGTRPRSAKASKGPKRTIKSRAEPQLATPTSLSGPSSPPQRLASPPHLDTNELDRDLASTAILAEDVMQRSRDYPSRYNLANLLLRKVIKRLQERLLNDQQQEAIERVTKDIEKLRPMVGFQREELEKVSCQRHCKETAEKEVIKRLNNLEMIVEERLHQLERLTSQISSGKASLVALDTETKQAEETNSVSVLQNERLSKELTYVKHRHEAIRNEIQQSLVEHERTIHASNIELSSLQKKINLTAFDYQGAVRKLFEVEKLVNH